MPRLLIIDDDPFIRELLTLKLEREGYVVLTADGGAAGLAAALEDPPDLVLLDWMMPGLTGPEVCTRLRAAPSTAGVPVIMLSARAGSHDQGSGLAAGATAYIAKPFSPRELVARIQAVLEQPPLADAGTAA